MLFFLLGLSGLALVVGLRVFAGYRRPEAVLQHLAAREAAFLDAAAEATYPPGGELPSGAEIGLPAYVDGWLALLPGRTRLLIRLLLALVEHATGVLPAPGPGGRRRFSSLDLAQREAALQGWRTSRIGLRRLVFTSLRALVTMGYFAYPPLLRRLEVAPLEIETPVCAADLLFPPVGRAPEAIRYGPADLGPPSDGTPLDPHGALHPAYAAGPP